MTDDPTFIPFGAYWTTPFCKWQGSFATQEPIPFAAKMATRVLNARAVPLDALDAIVLGTTIPSRHSFYGAPWLAGLIGAASATGPTISQACATSVRCLAVAADETRRGAGAVLVVAADRTSNGPHIYYPNPLGIGGTGAAENWVLDNFSHDPHAGGAMIATAENAARECTVSREQQNQVALLRHEQYQRALADDAAFHAGYMLSPVEITDARGNVQTTVKTDEGVFPTTAAGLAKLKPVTKDGTVTFGTQTHPADGNAGMIVCRRETAREWSRDSAVEVRLVATAQARVKAGFMPLANIPATRAALARAGIAVSDLAAITTHNPFAVNDIVLARELGVELDAINRFGCSLVWGHPQAPTGLRSIIELIEELAKRGGGYGLFTGCAAGDSASAAVIRVSVQ